MQTMIRLAMLALIACVAACSGDKPQKPAPSRPQPVRDTPAPEKPTPAAADTPAAQPAEGPAPQPRPEEEPEDAPEYKRVLRAYFKAVSSFDVDGQKALLSPEMLRQAGDKIAEEVEALRTHVDAITFEEQSWRAESDESWRCLAKVTTTAKDGETIEEPNREFRVLLRDGAWKVEHIE